MSTIITAWGLLKRLCGAAILIPFGLALIAMAVWMVRAVGNGWIAVAAAGWLGYQGLNIVIGVLSGFAGNGGPGRTDTADAATLATRRDLRRAGLTRRG